MPLTIGYTGASKWDNALFSVRFEAKQSLDSIAEILFFDLAGNKIEAQEGGRSKAKSADDIVAELLGNRPDDAAKPIWSSETVEYRLKTKVDSAKVVFVCWDGMDVITVPFDFTINLGF